jgi:hypothetical protein
VTSAGLPFLKNFQMTRVAEFWANAGEAAQLRHPSLDDPEPLKMALCLHPKRIGVQRDNE